MTQEKPSLTIVRRIKHRQPECMQRGPGPN